MPPRFMERMARQSETLKSVFGEPQDPPPYPFGRTSRSPSIASSQTTQKALPSPPPVYNQQSTPQRLSFEPQPAILRDSLVLVTGANSWQGIHIVDQLLERGYRVRGTVRDGDKAVWVSKFFGERYGAGRFFSAVIPDMAAKNAFDLAVRGCSGVVHVASVTSMSSNPNEVITPTIAGALNALEAAAREPNVKRFVYCSCVAASVSCDRTVRSEVTNQSWNMADFNYAWAPPPYDDERSLSVYASSKMQTEAAVWRWYEVKGPSFALNTVLPDTLWGRVLDPQHQNYPIAVTLLKALYDNSPADYPPSYFIDVQDSALIHVAALTLPDIRNQRIFAVNTPWNVQSLTQLLRGLYPSRKIAEEVADLGVDLTIFREAGKAEDLLRRMGRKGFTDLETSIERNCETFF